MPAPLTYFSLLHRAHAVAKNLGTEGPHTYFSLIRLLGCVEKVTGWVGLGCRKWTHLHVCDHITASIFCVNCLQFLVLLQNIPDRFRNGDILGSRVRYCAVGDCEANSHNSVGRNPETCAQQFVKFPAGSAILQLKSSCDYEIFVDASTTAGFNESLQLRPLFVAGHQNSKKKKRRKTDKNQKQF